MADMVFAIAFKVYSTFSGRRFMSDLRDAKERGYIPMLPHYNSIFNYFADPGMTDAIGHLIGLSSLPMRSIECDFSPDSSGFSTSRFTRWQDEKGRDLLQHTWVRSNIMCGQKTNVVTAVLISDRHDHDSPFLPALLKKTAENFLVRAVSADKGYSSVENLEVVDDLGARVYIPFKSNATGESGGLWRRMFHFYKYRQEEFLEHYHKRSNVEATFSMVKRKFGDSVRSKSYLAMRNEVLCKFLCHNICCLIQSIFELGIEPDLFEDKSLA
jgi:transposase